MTLRRKPWFPPTEIVARLRKPVNAWTPRDMAAIRAAKRAAKLTRREA